SLKAGYQPWGSASVDINVDNEGHFNGSRGSWLSLYRINSAI
ncbi:putative invasin, partial [Salmonella enterica subsp. enterica serovar Tallahassee str. 0012]